MAENERSRPATNGPASETALSTTSDPTVETVDATAAFREAFAVLVRGKSLRRHLYLNLPAAERVVRQARARGDLADLVLVRLVPVGSVSDD